VQSLSLVSLLALPRVQALRVSASLRELRVKIKTVSRRDHTSHNISHKFDGGLTHSEAVVSGREFILVRDKPRKCGFWRRRRDSN
jgi:hypothetical protein